MQKVLELIALYIQLKCDEVEDNTLLLTLLDDIKKEIDKEKRELKKVNN